MSKVSHFGCKSGAGGVGFVCRQDRTENEKALGILYLLTSPELVIGHVDYSQSKCTLNSPSSSSRDP